MLAFLCLLLTLAPPDTTLGDLIGRWVNLTPTEIVSAPDAELGPDSIRIETLASMLELTDEALTTASVYTVHAPHGDGELEALQVRSPYRAEGLILTVVEVFGETVRLRLRLDAGRLVVTLPDHPELPAETYQRPAEPAIPDDLAGLWTGRTGVADPAGIAFDVQMDLRLRADGTAAFEANGLTDAEPSAGPDVVALGRYVLLYDSSTIHHTDPDGPVYRSFSIAELSDDRRRLRWRMPHYDTTWVFVRQDGER